MSEVSTSAKVWDVAIKSMVPLSIIIAGALITHEVRISVIESNRFTSKDGEEIKSWVEARYPPKWLRDHLDDAKIERSEIKAMMKEMNKRLLNLELKKD